MKQTFLVFILAVFCSMSYGQGSTTPLSLISSAGGKSQITLNGNSNTIEWTLGETFIGGGTANDHIITTGEQQALPNTMGINEIQFSKIRVFPNPTSKYITIDNLPAGSCTITLMDMAGKTLIKTNALSNSQNIGTSQLVSGNYMLKITSHTDDFYTYKIEVINN